MINDIIKAVKMALEKTDREYCKLSQLVHGPDVRIEIQEKLKKKNIWKDLLHTGFTISFEN
ncbi:MAG: hypothetical protein QXR45_12275 [Candidatus Bathyarchaeia archaeon]